MWHLYVCVCVTVCCQRRCESVWRASGCRPLTGIYRDHLLVCPSAHRLESLLDQFQHRYDSIAKVMLNNAMPHTTVTYLHVNIVYLRPAGLDSTHFLWHFRWVWKNGVS